MEGFLSWVTALSSEACCFVGLGCRRLLVFSSNGKFLFAPTQAESIKASSPPSEYYQSGMSNWLQ